MKIAVAYIAVTNGRATNDFASRFVATYHEFPAGEPHELFVICNGGPLPLEAGMIFASTEAKFYPRPNDPGWDISAYLDFAKKTDAEMMVCLGESIYFHRAGWLKRIADVWRSRGHGMYGPFSSHCVRAHLNTSAFACAPYELRKYPIPVVDRASRYEFEHGKRALWRLMNQRGLPTMLVTWDGEWLPGQWRFPQNIMTRGTQQNCLMFCNHSDAYAMAPLQTKFSWERSSDRPFQ